MASPDRPAAIEWQADALRAFAHPSRLEILFMLHQGRYPVGMLAHGLGVSETTILKHLAVLRARSIVAMRREGRSVRYEIAGPEWDAFLMFLFNTITRNIPDSSGKLDSKP
ncbi:ArsR/SmtB family transcription factor [Shinella zoogloeoides]|uniref:ArsR/SmtB family transcription factor n=1 Tax=Shinella zoogloeoides TaxID=352475 RepID=UPI001F58DEEA|nr:metalloregulator ArsR/SmtB family transcription factor [Shinella zoogloeoides]